MTEPGPDSFKSRSAVVQVVVDDPPKVHYMSEEDVQRGHQSGVWSTDRSCYEFLARHCQAGMATLETGSGVSTALFAAWHTDHVCVTPGHEEAAALRAYCAEKGFDAGRVQFEVSRSDLALPRLGEQPLDLVLIDGNHGFPTPMIDWYYGAGRLRAGGVVVVDDVHLPAVRVLIEYLDSDPRWRRLAGNQKWAAFERVGNSPLSEDWFVQEFYWPGGLKAALRARATTLLRRIRPR